jgi:hypothetical protein
MKRLKMSLDSGEKLTTDINEIIQSIRDSREKAVTEDMIVAMKEAASTPEKARQAIEDMEFFANNYLAIQSGKLSFPNR